MTDRPTTTASPSDPAPTAAPAARLSLTVEFANGGRLAPDDVALIEAVGRARSIVGAGRALGQSYRKSWLMVDALNRMFESRVIDTFPGRRGAGAEVTAFGARLVALYRSAERRASGSAARALDEIAAGLDWSYQPDAGRPDLSQEAPATAAAPAARPR